MAAEGACGAGPDGPRDGEDDTPRRVAIDWDGLERALLRRRSSETQSFLDALTGDVVSLTRGWSDDHAFTEDELDEGLVARRLVPIEPLPAATERGWMEAFVASLEDGWAKDALAAALGGREPARAFEDALGFHPSERQLWLSCRLERMRAVVRAWLEAHEVEPLGEPPPRFRSGGPP
jgi:hypothetical protein